MWPLTDSVMSGNSVAITKATVAVMVTASIAPRSVFEPYSGESHVTHRARARPGSSVRR